VIIGGMVTQVLNLEPRTPKYIWVLNTLRQRIEDGDYTPGAALPSENQLATEFDVSRPTVLKALAFLKQDGWIESQQGRASFVRGKLTARRTVPAYAYRALHVDESTETELLSVAPVLADSRVARILAIPEGTPVYRRQRRLTAVEGATTLATVWLPIDVAAGSDTTQPEPIEGSILHHLADRKGVRGDYAVEWTSARRPSIDEALLLGIADDEPVLAIAVAVHTAGGHLILAVDVVTSGHSIELEDAYPLS
jgi:GntR family transcriptional regulator